MTILITGASGGLGREVARGLARAGSAHLILPVRDAHSGDALRSEIESLGCEKVSTPVLELASLSNVMTFIEDFRARGQPAGLQGLLFNAGRQSAHGLTFTADGFESTFAVNHLAHHALFRGLQDRLTPTATVGWTSSGTHDPNQRAARAFGFRGAQYQCNILMARHFGGSESGGRRFFAFDPGLMPGTGLAREQHGIALAAWNYVLPALIPVLPGASSAKRSGETYCKLLQGRIAIEPNGSYFDYTGRRIAPYIPDNVQSVIDELIRTSEELLTRERPRAAV